MLVYKLRATKPDLTDVDSPAQRDSWNRTWTFLEEHLRPYEDRSVTVVPVATPPIGR